MPTNSHPPEALQDQLLRDIARQGGFRRYAANTIIISEGDAADSLYIILTGRVKVYSSNDAGKEITIVTYGPGEYVGELALDGGVRSASVKTLEPTSCSVVSGSNLREFIAAHPDFGMHLIYKLIWRLRQATGSVKSLALQDVYGRIVRLLDELAVLKQGAERAVTERLTQQDIADRVGSSREMVSRIFKDLNSGGYVSVSSGRIRILKQPPSAW
jgi:CRP/FNR family cyclic AMP-dependent transcriptional regulator